VAGVVMFRFVTYWLPALPGAVAIRELLGVGCCDGGWQSRPQGTWPPARRPDYASE